MRRSLLALMFLLSLARCDCGGGKDECAGPADCPSTHECVTGAGGTKRCVLRAEPDADVVDPDLDASTAYYCDEVKPILDRTCVSNCHGVSRVGSMDETFQLDVYVQADGGAGAFAKAGRVKYRMADLKNMPPLSSAEQPTALERRRVGVWAKRGAPFCPDAGL